MGWGSHTSWYPSLQGRGRKQKLGVIPAEHNEDAAPSVTRAHRP